MSDKTHDSYLAKSEASDWHFPSLFLSLGYEDDKVQLPFTVTDLKGRNLQLVNGPHNGQVNVCASVFCTCKFRYLYLVDLPILEMLESIVNNLLKGFM